MRCASLQGGRRAAQARVAAAGVDARVLRDAQEPAPEPRGFLERLDGAPGGDERLLGEVLGPLGFPGLEDAARVDHAAREANQLLERVRLAPPRAPGQFFDVHVTLLCLRTLFGRGLNEEVHMAR